jgi:hypothetical protein
MEKHEHQASKGNGIRIQSRDEANNLRIAREETLFFADREVEHTTC